MPSELIFSARTMLRAAIQWMQAFPDPVQLRSKYREAIKPDEEKESLKVVAYRLSRLYGEHTKEPLRVKDIECRIAELETAYLRQNIQYDSNVGCPAVRLQIRAVKRSNIRTAVDLQLRKDLKLVASKLKECAQRDDLDTFSKTLGKLMKKWKEHDQSYAAWSSRTEARLKEDLRRRANAAESPDELVEAGEVHLRHLRNLLDLRDRWLEESRRHLDALSAPEADIFEYSKVMRNWMKSWESLWALPPEGIWFQMSSV